MKKLILRIIIIGIVALCCASTASAQGYIKLNGLYALGGVVNPQVEIRLTEHSAFQTEFTYSPWKSIGGHHMHFGLFTNEYRYYFREANSGLYIGAEAGIMLFDVSKPQFASLYFKIATARATVAWVLRLWATNGGLPSAGYSTHT